MRREPISGKIVGSILYSNIFLVIIQVITIMVRMNIHFYIILTRILRMKNFSAALKFI